MKQLLNTTFYKAAIISLLLVGIYLAPQPTVTQGNTKAQLANQVGSFPETALEAEAVAQAKKTWEDKYIRCEDSCYWLELNGDRSLYTLTQWKGISYNLDEVNPISEAEKLNGVEWKGRVAVNWKLRRSYSSRRKTWSEWSNGDSFSMSAQKKKGKWDIHVLSANAAPMTCAELPK